MPKQIEVSDREFESFLEKPDNNNDVVINKAEVIYPNPLYGRQADFCRLRLEGYSLEEIQDEIGIDHTMAKRYSMRFKPFLARKLVELEQIRHGENLQIIRDRIRAKAKEVEKNPDADKSGLIDWVKLDMQNLNTRQVAKPPASHTLIQIIDNNQEVKSVEVRVKENEPTDTVHPASIPEENTGE